MKNTLAEFVLANNPELMAAYEQSQLYSEEDLIAGIRVLTLRAGFGGARGKTLTIIENNGDHLVLSDNDGKYLLYFRDERYTHWTKSIRVLNDNETQDSYGFTN